LYNVDRTRTFVSGHSRGGAMSVIAAFEMPEVFAGFCAQAGFADYNDYLARMEKKAPELPFAAYILHGVADPDVPVEASDNIAETMLASGWLEDETLIYNRLPGVTHRWQPQYNEQVWEFLSTHPLPIAQAAE
ncbi:MAG: prolyl oligopeptidase family serine peptidase, partial [Proteobacteria bacterium]|nr:prolyl oligopeptidase family serine peptidase [Pseudomonadota bacterium]